MDLNLIRAVATALAFASFIGICWWAYSRRRQDDFEVAARLPLDDEPRPLPGTEGR